MAMGGLNEKEDEYIRLVQTGWIVIFHSSIHVRTLGAKEIVPREGFQGEPRYICQRTVYLQMFQLWMFLKFVFFWSGRLARSFTPGRLTLAEGKSWPTSCHWSGDKPFFFVEMKKENPFS